MDWKTALVAFALLYYANGYSKYGRTCKDIGCLNSEVCVLAEDPCSFGHTSNCGTYPTCKKKSQVEGSHSEPQPSVPKPKPQTPTHDFDSPPSYKPPSPPDHGVSFGGNSPYGGSSGGNSPYGGSSGGNSPYGGSGGNSPYGGSGGNSPYGGSGGNSPYGGSPYGGSGGNSPYGGSPYGGGNSNPYGGNNNPYGGSSPYGSNTGGSHYGGGSPYGSNTGGSGGKGPLDSIFNSLSNFGSGGGGSPGSSGGNGLGNIFGSLLNNLSRNGLNGFVNTRPIMENPNYSSYSSNSRSSNPQTYPSGQSYQTSNKKSSAYNRATTRRPVSYGWNVSVTVVLTYLMHQYIQNMFRNS